MPRLLYRFLIFVPLLTLLLSSRARAGDTTYIIHVKMPFRFRVADRNFPSGEYELVSKAPGLVLLCDSAGRLLTAALARAIELPQTPEVTRLMFRKHGKRFELVQIWVEHRPWGQELYRLDEARGQLGEPQAITPGMFFEAFPSRWLTEKIR